MTHFLVEITLVAIVLAGCGASSQGLADAGAILSGYSAGTRGLPNPVIEQQMQRQAVQQQAAMFCFRQAQGQEREREFFGYCMRALGW